MDNKVPVTIYVDPKYLPLIETGKGIIEIVVRRENAKFLKFIKASLLNGASSTERESLAKQLFNTDSSGNILFRAHELLNAEEQKKLQQYLKTVISKMLNSKSLSSPSSNGGGGKLGTALQITNILVDVAGFVVIYAKLQSVSDQISKLEGKLDNMQRQMVNEKLGRFDYLSTQYKVLYNKFKQGDALDWDKLDSYLVDVRSFVKESISNYSSGAIDGDIALNMVFSLLDAYTQIFGMYLREFYFARGRITEQYEVHMDFYRYLLSDSLYNSIKNHLFINDKVSYEETVHTIQAEKLSVLKCHSKIVDLVTLLQATGSKEEYYGFLAAIDAAGRQVALDAISDPALQSSLSQEEINKLLDEAFQPEAAVGF